MNKTVTKLAALMAATLLLLTGCAQNPNTAAIVGDQTITMSSVDAFAHQLETAVASVTQGSGQEVPTWGALRASALQVLVQIEIVKAANLDAKVTVTDAQRQNAASSNAIYGALAKDPAAANVLSQWLDAIVVANDAKGSAALTKAASSTPVTVNPVFGTWDPSQLKLSGESGSLSKSIAS